MARRSKRAFEALPAGEPDLIAILAHACIAGLLAAAPDPAPVHAPAPAPATAKPRRERAIVVGVGAAVFGGLGLSLLVPAQAVRFTRDRRAARRCIQQPAEATATSDGVDPASICFGRARHPLGVASLAALGFLGGAAIVGGAAQIGTGLGKLARSDHGRRRTDPRIAVGATLTAIGGATILVGAPVLFARQRRGPLHEWSQWQGARFLVTDAGILVGAIGVGLLTHAVARRDRDRRRHVQIHPTAGLHGAGIAATIRW